MGKSSSLSVCMCVRVYMRTHIYDMLLCVSGVKGQPIYCIYVMCVVAVTIYGFNNLNRVA